MKDLNYFESYVQKPKRESAGKGIYAIFAIVVIFLAAAAFLFYRHLKIRTMSKTVESLRQTAEDPVMLEQVERVVKKEAEKNQFKEAVEKVVAVDSVIQSQDRIDGELFDRLTSCLPDSTFLSSVNVTPNGFTLTGISKDKWSVAEFARALESVEGVVEVFTPSLFYDEGFFEFSIEVDFMPVLTEPPAPEESEAEETPTEELEGSEVNE